MALQRQLTRKSARDFRSYKNPMIFEKQAGFFFFTYCLILIFENEMKYLNNPRFYSYL
jgi:hypothetical protein